ncbi:MAG: DEAD/DEAH box helicase [Candidatus Glassbacteria bacterium]|nr:DEAD/DEAH box helicase [Candidatus Glassbacteria bacterium]
MKLFKKFSGFFGKRSRVTAAPEPDGPRAELSGPPREPGPDSRPPGKPSRRRHSRRGRKKPGDRQAQPRQAGESARQTAERPQAHRAKPDRGGDGGSAPQPGRPAKSRRHRKPSHHGRRRDLGGVAQRVDFPELLEIDPGSSEFQENGFRPLGLSDRLVAVLAANRFRTPTDIQKAVIPAALRGADIMGQAQTGTGKTIAFLMPIFEKLDRSGQPRIQALVVVPTRELCRQVAWEARRFGRSFNTSVISLYGGTSVPQEIRALEEGAHIIVGTPGRLLDHIYNRNLDLTALKTLVLDEADRMFDIGFRQDIIKIIKACPEGRQIMLLSATLEGEVEEISRKYMKDPVPLYVSRDEISVESIWQRFIPVNRHQKMDLLVRLLETQKPTQSLIFTNTKRMSDAVAMQLEKKGFKACCIHSDLNQNKRERIIDAFRTARIEHLAATDVAARGLDITGISHVINYDIPENPEDYVHRVGRTGRMGSAGKAFTFVTQNEGKQLSGVEKFINKQIEEWDEHAV